MKRLFKFLSISLFMISTLFGKSIVPIHATTPITTTNGWLTDLEGNLVTDNDGYFVYTISSSMIKDNKLTINLDKFASLFLNDFRNESSAFSTHKLKIVNSSGREVVYNDYSFTTENVLPRSNNLFIDTKGSFTNILNRAFGSAYRAMMPTITSPTYRTDLSLPVQGFDGKNINIMIVNLRCVNDAIMAFYGVNNTFDVTLPQMMYLDANLLKVGYASYADYLRDFYHVSDLRSLPLTTVYNILGTTRGAQSAITNWKDNTIEGKMIPQSEVGQLTDQMKVWGILSLNQDEFTRDMYPYIPNYFMMETDPEMIRFAYDYLYANGLRFSFDQFSDPFSTLDSELGNGGNFGIKAYVEKNVGSTAKVNRIFSNLELKNGQSITLDHVSAGLYVPNAWNQYRLYDFGFSLYFTAKKPNIIIPPDTGDDTNLMLWAGMLIGSVLGIFGLIVLIRYRRKEDEEDA